MSKLLRQSTIAFLGLGLFASSAYAFPDGATTPSATAIRDRVAGNVFNVKLANGVEWRLEFNTNGYFFVDVSTGAKVSGEWKSEDGKLCSKIRTPDFTCGAAKVHENFLYVQRADGEIIKYIPH